MKRTLQHAVYTPVRTVKDDPSYPGVPLEKELAAKSQTRANVPYDTYVLQYGARQTTNAFIIVMGLMVAVAGGLVLGRTGQILAIIGGVGVIMVGGLAYLTTADAHGLYTRYLAVSTTETYNRQPPTPPPATVRPYVASANGDGRTTNTGRLKFAPAVWQSLFDLALANGGVISKENVCMKAGVGRQWYHTDPNAPDGFRAFQSELHRIGFIDTNNRLTDIALAWYEQQIALPLSALPLRPAYDRPTGDRPATDRARFSGQGGAE